MGVGGDGTRGDFRRQGELGRGKEERFMITVISFLPWDKGSLVANFSPPLRSTQEEGGGGGGGKGKGKKRLLFTLYYSS